MPDAYNTGRDLWRWPTLLLWFLFLVLGADLEEVFLTLRVLGGVTTFHALINNHWLLYLAWVAFFSFFVYSRCRLAGLDARHARAKTTQLAAFAFLAFLPMGISHLPDIRFNPDFQQRILFYSVAFSKILIWTYLGSVILRHYFFGRRVFWRIRVFFPSISKAKSGFRR
jgi:hypothetical protein